MTFEEYKKRALRHVVLPSTEGCEGGPLEFDLIMPPAAVVNPMTLAFYEKVKPYQDIETEAAIDARVAAGVVLYTEVLKASTWPEGFGLESVNDVEDLNYLLKVAADFFGRGNKTQTKDGVSPAASETTPVPSLEPDSNEAGTFQVTV
jgi:hypothetical protein